jgi:diguanylate cyclase (GGDEF)-like protein
MSSNNEKPKPETPSTTAPLVDALSRSEHVQGQVEQAAVDLSAVNAVMKDGVAEVIPRVEVERALRKSESVEVQVQEAATELVAVNAALAREIDERHHLERQLAASAAALSASRADAKSSSDRALHDPFTGLPNLTLFNDRLLTALAQAERRRGRLAVMFIDLDGFKRVNDTHGHAAGDRVLQIVATRLRTIVRKGDTVSRRSGDEFLFLMLEAKDPADIEALAARIGAMIADPCGVDGVEVAVTASIGIALYPEDGGSAEQLLEHADMAMYVAKKDRTGIAFFARPAPTRS